MTALEPAVRPTAAEVAALLGAGASRRDRGGYGHGVHRLRRPRHAAVPRAVGLAVALATAATITAAALPASGPVVPPGPAPSSGVVPVPTGGPAPWTPASATVSVDRMADVFGDGADAARRRAAAAALRNRTAPPAASRWARTPEAAASSAASGDSDAPGRHRADD
jgi:hypothetical protein